MFSYENIRVFPWKEGNLHLKCWAKLKFNNKINNGSNISFDKVTEINISLLDSILMTKQNFEFNCRGSITVNMLKVASATVQSI